MMQQEEKWESPLPHKYAGITSCTHADVATGLYSNISKTCSYAFISTCLFSCWEAKPRESISFKFYFYHQWSFTVSEKKELFTFGQRPKECLSCIFERNLSSSLIYDRVWDHVEVCGRLLSMTGVGVLESGDLASVSAVTGHGFSLVPSLMYIFEVLLFLSRWIQAFYHLFLIGRSWSHFSIRRTGEGG